MDRSSNSSRRVVITGMGMICPLGMSKDILWDRLASRQSGVRKLGAEFQGFPVEIAGIAGEFTGKVEDFGELPADLKKAIRKGVRMMCRETQMAIAAGQRALVDAAPGDFYPPERKGVIYGADYMLTEPADLTASVRECQDVPGHFEFSRWGVQGLNQMEPLWLLKYLPNMPASHVAIFNDFRGPNNSLTQREAASNLAIGEALRVISRGDADLMIAGSTGTRIHPVKAMHAVIGEEVTTTAEDPAAASRPFDKNRTGVVLGEGAGAIVLEELESARKRGATILAEVVGAASSAVMGRDAVARRGQAILNVLKASLRDARLSPRDLGHVHAHGLSTRSCDEEEALAIHEVFGGNPRPIPVTAAKSYFGNLGAAGGVVELAASVMALVHRRMIPLLNFATPDSTCGIHPATEEDSPGDSFVNVNVTPQGQASAIVVRRYE